MADRWRFRLALGMLCAATGYAILAGVHPMLAGAGMGLGMALAGRYARWD